MSVAETPSESTTSSHVQNIIDIDTKNLLVRAIACIRIDGLNHFSQILGTFEVVTWNYVLSITFSMLPLFRSLTILLMNDEQYYFVAKYVVPI